MIGGGDWAVDRIVPDAIRSLANVPIPVRNRSATRPWQHVIEPLAVTCGLPIPTQDHPLCDAYNFGPTVQPYSRRFGEKNRGIGRGMACRSDLSLHEANLLHLQVDKAITILAGNPVGFPQRLPARCLVSAHHDGVAALDCCLSFKFLLLIFLNPYE